MKPVPFIYVRPETLDEALSLLTENEGDAKIIAGGQSLVPMMNFRLAEPKILIDINRLPELQGVGCEGDAVHLGAVTRYAEIEHSPSLAAAAPLLVQAMPLVAHPGVRNRGTIGGSIALADPSAETPACCIGLDARIQLKSRARGMREVAAADFFQGIYATDARDDEIIVGIDIRKAPPDRRFAIREISPRHGDFALAGALVAATLTGDRLSDVRLVFFAVADTPLVAAQTQRALEGVAVRDKKSIDEAASCLAADIDFKADPQLSAEHRQRISRTLLSRLIADLEGSV